MEWVRGGLTYFHGDYAAAEAHLRKATTVFREIGPGALVWYLGMLALTLATAGKRQAADECLTELEGLVDRLSEGPTTPYAYLLETSLRIGDRARAERVYPRLMRVEGQLHDFLVDRLLGADGALAGRVRHGAPPPFRGGGVCSARAASGRACAHARSASGPRTG